MMKMQPIQYGFSSGEITPRLYGNTQSEVYRNGVAELLNMAPLAQGPAKSRSGSFYLGDAGNDEEVRLIPFNLSRGDDYVVEFGPLYLRIWNQDGLVNLLGQELIIDNKFIRELLFWDDNSTGGANITFNHNAFEADLNNAGGGSTAIISQRMRDVQIDNFGVSHTVTGVFSGDGELLIEIGTTEGASDLLSETVTVTGDFEYFCTPVSAEIWIQFSNSAGSNTTAGVAHPNFNVITVATEIATTYLIEELHDIQFEMLSSTETLILAHSQHPPAQLELNEHTDFKFSDITFAEPPAEWMAGNYPNVVSTYQGRLWFARTPSALQTFWASQSGDYYNFALGTGLDNEALQFQLASTGEIEWLRGQKELMMGTSQGEHRVTAQTGVITPSDIDIRQQSAYGSAQLHQGENIGDQIIYVSPDHKKVRGLTFDAFQQGWYSPDITWIAQHITQAGIKETHFARDPDNVLALVLINGDVAFCTYDRAQNTTGWSLYHNDTINAVSAAVTNGDLGSTTFYAAKQDNGKITILIDSGTFRARNDMDSAISRPIEVGNVVTGLEHLEGMEVVVKVDTAIHPNRTVVGGEITLDYMGENALVGLGFVSRLKTLPLDVGSSNGSGAANMKHWAKIYVRVIDSAIPKVNGVRDPTREPSTPMGEGQPVVTQDIQASVLGRSRAAQITIEQDLPLPLTILNIVGIEGQDVL